MDSGSTSNGGISTLLVYYLSNGINIVPAEEQLSP